MSLGCCSVESRYAYVVLVLATAALSIWGEGFATFFAVLGGAGSLMMVHAALRRSVPLGHVARRKASDENALLQV